MSAADTYLSIKNIEEVLYKEKGSRFLAYAFPVGSELEVKEHLLELRKKYYDATHHCYAYVIGRNGEQSRAQDDGEPSGTAGLPILNQIKSKALTNVLVVVVRYFGGTKLGASGLVSAYKTAAGMVLEACQTQECIVSRVLQLSFDYIAMNDVMRIVKDYELPILTQHFDNQCQMTLQVREKYWNEVSDKVTKIDLCHLVTQDSK
jgi:uncharacterized YigZ family protein